MLELFRRRILRLRLRRFFNLMAMKNFFIAAAVAIMSVAGAHKANAGILGDGLGVTAGVNFSTLDGLKDMNMSAAAGFNVGVLYDFKIPVPVVPIHIQPSLTYTMKSADIGIANTDFSVGYLELMASIQPSLDLMLARIFLDISPYVGYGLHGSGDFKKIWSKDIVNKLEYGIGLGAGLKIWKIQALARYSWNFGGLVNTTDTMDDGFGAMDVYKTVKGANFGGVTVSVAYIF